MVDFNEYPPNLIPRKKKLPFKEDNLLIVTKIYKLLTCNFSI